MALGAIGLHDRRISTQGAPQRAAAFTSQSTAATSQITVSSPCASLSMSRSPTPFWSEGNVPEG